MASPFKQYVKALRKKKAAEKILADLKKPVLRELNRKTDGKHIEGDVEFHLTEKREAIFPTDVEVIIQDLTQKIKDQKQRAIDAATVQYDSTPSFDAEVPKSSMKKFLSEDADYRRHFN